MHCFRFSAVWSRSIQFAILNLIRVYTICGSQDSDQGIHYLLSFPSTIIKVYTICHSQQYDQGLYYLQFSIWSGSTIFAILGGIISVYSTCHSQQDDQCLHCLPYSAVWSVSTVLAILRRLISVYTVCHTQQSDHGLHYLLHSAVWSRSWSTFSFSGTVWAGSTVIVILSSLIKVYNVCHSQHSD